MDRVSPNEDALTRDLPHHHDLPREDTYETEDGVSDWIDIDDPDPVALAGYLAEQRMKLGSAWFFPSVLAGEGSQQRQSRGTNRLLQHHDLPSFEYPYPHKTQDNIPDGIGKRDPDPYIMAGYMAVQQMKISRTWLDVSELEGDKKGGVKSNVNVVGEGNVEGEDSQFLSYEQLVDVRKCETVSDLIHFFGPYFVKELAKQKPTCSLVNSERHTWVRNSEKSPAWVGLHSSSVQVNKTTEDSVYDFEGALFGQPAHWELRDSVDFIALWVKGESYGALGEGIAHATNLAAEFDSDYNVVSGAWRDARRPQQCGAA
jgi:hypothetical protein